MSLPRPSAQSGEMQIIPAPPESSFTSAFGQLLPPAVLVATQYGQIATYLLPSSNPSNSIPIILIHGIQTPALGLFPFAIQLQQLCPDRPIALFDLFGHGLTGTPIVAHTQSIFFNAINALMAHYKWAKADFIGYSLGGSILAGYTSEYPDKVHSATLVAPAGLMEWSSFTPEQRRIIRQGTGSEEKAREIIFSWLEDGDLIVPPDAHEGIGRGEVVAEAIRGWQLENHKGYPDSVVSIIRDGGVMENHEAFRKMVKTGVKCMAVLGAEDGVCDKTACTAVGVEEVHVLEKAGHGVVRTHAKDVAELVNQFWE